MMSLYKNYENQKSLDIEKVNQLKQLGLEIEEDVLQQLTQAHIESVDAILNEMNSALKQQNFEDLMRSAHKFKSSCANLGLMKLHHLCQDFEKLISQFLKMKTFDARMIQEFIDCITYEAQYTNQQLQEQTKAA